MVQISDKDRELYLEKALKTADWFVNQQLSFPKPWRADMNRFCYYYYMPEKKYVPGLNWTMGRALFVLSEAYKVLGVKETDDDQVIKKAYRKLMSEHHPDKLIAQGVPEEAIKMATEKAQTIQAAYELIKKHRS